MHVTMKLEVRMGKETSKCAHLSVEEIFSTYKQNHSTPPVCPSWVDDIIFLKIGPFWVDDIKFLEVEGFKYFATICFRCSNF